jgi:hypothetical protein
MSQPADPTSVPGAVARLGQSLIGAMPPSFLLLLLLNIAFGFTLIWFLDDQLEQRNKMAEQLFHRCLEVALHDTP